MRRGWLAALLAAGSMLGTAGPAFATITSSNITTPADGAQLFQDQAVNPDQKFTVTGTSDGTTGDAVDIDCYQGSDSDSALNTYEGVPVQGDGSFSAQIPESSFSASTCHLVAVPTGTEPALGSDYTGPRVAFSEFQLSTIAGGPNAGQTYNFLLGDSTMTAQSSVYGLDGCGPASTLLDGSPAEDPSNYVFDCVSTFYNSSGELGGPADLTRSEIQVDGHNAYGSYSAFALFPGSPSVPGFPAATVRLNSFDASTGNAEVSDTEPLAKCIPNDKYNPTAADCAAFASTGVSVRRVTQWTDGARVATVSDTYTSTDRAPHTLDLLYDADLQSTVAGWRLPGEDSFSQHDTGDRAGGTASAPATIYAIDDPAQLPSFANPVGAMTFATPYAAVRFDDTLWNGESSALIEYRKAVPGGGSVTLTWSYATGTSLSEVHTDALHARDAMQPPAVTISAPGSGSRVADTLISVRGSARAGSGIASVKVNGVAARVSGGHWSARVPLTPGPNALSATVTSVAGARQTTTETVTLDLSAPSISITAPANGATYAAGQLVKARFRCTDPDGAGDAVRCVGSRSRVDTSAMGKHTFTVGARDRAGNYVTQTVTYTVRSSAHGGQPTPAVTTSDRPSHDRQGKAVVVTPGIMVWCPAARRTCAAIETATTVVTRANHRTMVIVGRATITLKANSSMALAFVLDRSGAKLLAALGELHVKVTSVTRVAGNAPLTTTKTITI